MVQGRILGVNAIEVGAQIVQAIQAIHLDPMMSYSAKLTKFQAGGAISQYHSWKRRSLVSTFEHSLMPQ